MTTTNTTTVQEDTMATSTDIQTRSRWANDTGTADSGVAFWAFTALAALALVYHATGGTAPDAAHRNWDEQAEAAGQAIGDAVGFGDNHNAPAEYVMDDSE